MACEFVASGDNVKISIRTVAAGVLLAAAAVTGFFAFRVYMSKGKYVFRSEPKLKKVEVTLEKKPLKDRAPLSLELCRSKLSGEGQEEAYREISDCVLQTDGAAFWLYKASFDDFKIAMNAFLNDHPEVFWVDSASGYKYYDYGDKLNVELNFSESGEQLKADREALGDAVELAAAGAPDNASDYEVELYLNDYLGEVCEYSSEGEMKHSSYGALVQGQAVCDGYSHAFQLLCRRLGIECTTVDGTSDFNSDHEDGHMWNCVLLNGNWYHVDVTWNDSPRALCEAEHYFYLNLTEEQIKRDHVISGDFAHRADNAGQYFNIFVPVCNSDELNYFRLNYVTIKDPEDDDDILAALIEASRRKRDYVAYVIDDSVDFSSMCDRIIDEYAVSWIDGANHFTKKTGKLTADGKAVTYEDKRLLAFQLEYE